MKKDIWRKILSAGLLVAALLVVLSGLSACGTKRNEPEELSAETLQILSSTSGRVLFCGNVDMSRFGTDVFSHNLGVDACKLNQAIAVGTELHQALESLTGRKDGYAPEALYLYLDPRTLGGEETSYQAELEAWITAFPEMKMVLFLAPPMLQEWLSLSEEQCETLLSSYMGWIRTVDTLDKGKVYFAGAEEWLIGNPANYENGLPNEEVADTLLAMTFADGKYSIDQNNGEGYLDILRQEIRAERENPTIYPDLSGVDIVFFGDSIIGNYMDSTSISGVVNGLSGARVYNLGEGGAPAQGSLADPHTFVGAADVFLSGNPENSPAKEPFEENYRAFLKDDHGGRKPAFVINYGLNDYFGGGAVDDPADPYNTFTYAGALRSGIKALRSAYPDALLILATPNVTMLFDQGEEIRSEIGGPLSEYAEAARRVAVEENILCLDNYRDLGITVENAELFLTDGTHFNETGRMIIGERIIYLIGTQIH